MTLLVLLATGSLVFNVILAFALWFAYDELQEQKRQRIFAQGLADHAIKEWEKSIEREKVASLDVVSSIQRLRLHAMPTSQVTH